MGRRRHGCAPHRPHHPFLNVNTEVGSLAGWGRSKPGRFRDAGDPLAGDGGVHMVTLLERCRSRRPSTGSGTSRAAGLNVGSVFVNMLRAEVLAEGAVESDDRSR